MCSSTLFGIFFSTLLSYAFQNNDDGVYLHTRSDGRLFNLARLRAKTKVSSITIREALLADDAALATHTEAALQRLVDRLAHACSEFGLTISLKKTEVMSQGTESPPSIHIGDYHLNPVSQFQYLGSTISFNLSLEPEISARIAKAAGMMSKLQKRVWDNNNLTNSTKMQVSELASSAPCSTQVRPGQPMLHKRRGSTAFTSTAFGASWASAGKTWFPTPRCSSGQDCRPFSPSWPSVD